MVQSLRPEEIRRSYDGHYGRSVMHLSELKREVLNSHHVDHGTIL
jgi:hypothetical protein